MGLRPGAPFRWDAAKWAELQRSGLFEASEMKAAIVGKAGAAIDQAQLCIDIGGVAVAANGMRVDDYDETPVTAHMTGQHVEISVRVGTGSGAARVWTCDLTHGYIEINADYRS